MEIEHPDCIFCNPAAGTEICRNADGIVVLAGPARPGHVLVGILDHRPSLHEVEPAAAAGMMRLAAQISQSIVRQTSAEKTYVVAIGDRDKHFHVHLIPKMNDDPPLGPHVFGGDGWAAFLPPHADDDAVRRIAETVRSECA